MYTFFLVSAGIGVGVGFPDALPPRPLIHTAAQFITRTLSLPAESIFMGWQPSYPSTVRTRPIPPPLGIRQGQDFAAAIEQAPAPTKWAPTFPDRILRQVQPPHMRPSYFLPPLGELINIGARMSWSPRYPDRVFRVPFPLKVLGGLSYVTLPAIVAAGELCVELVDTSFAVSALISETVTVPVLLSEALSVPALISEGLC